MTTAEGNLPFGKRWIHAGRDRDEDREKCRRHTLVDEQPAYGCACARPPPNKQAGLTNKPDFGVATWYWSRDTLRMPDDDRRDWKLVIGDL